VYNIDFTRALIGRFGVVLFACVEGVGKVLV